MRKQVALAATAALFAGLVAVATPAAAACANGDTTCTGVTFTVAAGTVSLIAPGTATGGTATTLGSGATIDIPLGSTIVNDTRVGSTGWSVSATASSFATTGGSIDKSNASFSVPSAATAPTGVLGISTCSSTTRKTTPVAVDANGTTSAIIACTQAGASGATFIPVLTVAVPSGSIAGTYTGTVTQSVA
jgi:hypothetical protein